MLRAAILLSALLLAAPAEAAVAEKLVYKIDSVIATVAHSHLLIEVKGAVPSGGWKTPKLKLMHGDAHTVVVELVARPPAAGAAVIRGLLPVSASITAPMRPGVVSVRVVSDANEMTTQILK